MKTSFVKCIEFSFKFVRRDSAIEMLTVLALSVFDTLHCECRYTFSQLLNNCNNS